MHPHAAPFLALICLIFAAAGDITNTVNTGRRAGSMSGLVLDVYGVYLFEPRYVFIG